MKSLLLICMMALPACSFGQESAGNFLKDPKTGCTVWFKHTFAEDSVSWSGGCKGNYADGYGTMTGFTEGKQTCQYVGTMQNGKPNGAGVFTFGGNRKLQGNFSNGEILNLRKQYLERLDKNIIAETDSSELYVGDNNAKQLYYHALVPEGKLRGALVLMPGTWETTEHLISSTQLLCESAYDSRIAVLVFSVNQRLTMTETIVKLMNNLFDDAIGRYHIPANKIVIGGWSMGGLFSLRYTEFANQDSTKTAVTPVAVFSCDGPCDLEHIYNNFQKKKYKNPNSSEPQYGINDLEKYCGGSPDAARNNYNYYSCYTHALADGGNAKYLQNTPVRIYGDVDPVWWMQNRRVDMYDLNALDQTAMIQLLNDMGNKRAEFINAFQKGIRIEGNRHPHSWSIVEPKDCMDWILACLL